VPRQTCCPKENLIKRITCPATPPALSAVTAIGTAIPPKVMMLRDVVPTDPVRYAIQLAYSARPCSWATPSFG
jgi:hypothetical protein